MEIVDLKVLGGFGDWGGIGGVLTYFFLYSIENFHLTFECNSSNWILSI